MDYEQQLAGRSSHDPSRDVYRARPEGSTGGVFLVVVVILAALAVVFWLAGAPPGTSPDGRVPAADTSQSAPATDPAETAAPPLLNPEPATPPAGSPAPADP